MEHGHTRPDTHSLTSAADQPLIGILAEENGQRVVRYSAGSPVATDGADADARLGAALSVIGAWSDLDWEDFSTELDRIRHESQPTPPIEV